MYMKKLMLTLNVILPVGMLVAVSGLNAELKMPAAAKPATENSDKKNLVNSDGSSVVVKVVSGRDIISGSEEGKKMEEDLSKKRSKIEDEGKRMEQELKNDVVTLQGKSKLMDSSALETQQDKIIKKEKKFKAELESMQEEFGRNVNRDLNKFNAKINEKVLSIAKNNKWDMVVLKESGEVIYASDKVDATKDIIKALNADFKPSVK